MNNKIKDMNYRMNEIKIELFDKCHELVYEYMQERAKHDRTWVEGENLSEEEFHEYHGRLMKKVFKELSGDVVAFYQTKNI